MIDLGGWMVEMMEALIVERLVAEMAANLVAGWDK
jgi:hypothetical protein